MKRIGSILAWVLPPLLLVALGITAYFTQDQWKGLLSEPTVPTVADDPHAGHAHGALGDAIVLTPQARDNLNLKIGTVATGTYWEKLSMPGEVTEIPGRSDLALTTQVAGIIEEVFALPGQAVRPGDALFTIRITDDDVITAQSAMLNAIQRMKINQAEINRITPLVPNSVPQSTLLKVKYEQDTLEVQRNLHKQELIAHGLSDAQIEEVANGRIILKALTIRVPDANGGEPTRAVSSPSSDESETIYTVASVEGYRGRNVNAGDLLGMLATHGRLLVRGHAFEKESGSIERALVNNWPVTVEFVVGETEPLIRSDMEILFTENVISAGSRTLEFYLSLDNDIVARRSGKDGGDYISWRFKPGQQARLMVPARKWDGVIVLPTEAVTEEGPNAYAFTVNGKKLERRAVHRLYRDAGNVVVADDGSLFMGQRIALNNAYQLNLALKKQQGSGADPHAGHMH